MATKRQKKEEAKRLVKQAIPSIPAPLGKLAPPLRIPSAILTGAGLLAEGLIEVDPLGIITESPTVTTTSPSAPTSRQEAIERMVNDPGIKIDASALDMINDDSIVMANGRFARLDPGQFDLVNTLPTGIEKKRTRKKTKTDKNMSEALRQANKKFRKANGQLRKGATQAQIMKYAHKLLRRMSK